MPSSKNKKISKPFNLFTIIGIGLIALSLSLFCAIFWPVMKEEIVYQTNTMTTPNEIIPVDTDFGIVIPKINANATVIPEVDPYDSRVYQKALTQGVAHAKGTRFFLFSHSSVNFYEANRYNSVFYLLNKLETGDTIDLYYQQNKLLYRVTGKKIVHPNEVHYMTQSGNYDTLTLMTCWPPGTTYKRLLIIADQKI